MATPLDMTQQQEPQTRAAPRTVLAAKVVDLALVTFTDESGQMTTTLALVGDSKVHLLDGQSLGLTRARTPQGLANEWLRKGIFEKLERPEPQKAGAKK